MFSFKSIVALLAAATAVVTALPTVPGNGANLAKRVADPSPMGVEVFARAPEPVTVPLLEVRDDAPTTIPDAITKAHGTIDPILVNIRASFLQTVVF